MMLQIAEHLPREMQGILACCSPIPRLVRQNLHKLHTIVLEARNQPLVEEELRRRVSTLGWNKENLDGDLYFPHDLTHIQDLTPLRRTDNINKTEVGAQKIQMNKPMIEIDSPIHVTSGCPHERYKKEKAFIQSQEAALSFAGNISNSTWARRRPW
jgi:hypothetical protein